MDANDLVKGLMSRPLKELAERLRSKAEYNRGMARAYNMESSSNMAMGYETRAEALDDVIEAIEEMIEGIEG